MLREEDSYYFGHHGDVVMPVYRVILGDAETTRYYLDPTSGALLERVEANRRWYRWLFAGLHRVDFFAWLRARPTWDIAVMMLLLGGIGVSGTGAYLGFRRVRRDLTNLLRLFGSDDRKSVPPRMDLR